MVPKWLGLLILQPEGNIAGARGKKGSEKAPVKTGMEWRMQEPHGKGLANRSNPESCAGGGNIAGEALTRTHTGQPLAGTGQNGMALPQP